MVASSTAPSQGIWVQRAPSALQSLNKQLPKSEFVCSGEGEEDEGFALLGPHMSTISLLCVFWPKRLP